MADSVLLGDHKHQRAEKLRRILNTHFDVKIKSAQNFKELSAILESVTGDHRAPHVLIADDLLVHKILPAKDRKANNKSHSAYRDSLLIRHPGVKFCLIPYSGSLPQFGLDYGNLFFLSAAGLKKSPKPEDFEQLLGELERLIGPRMHPEPPHITLDIKDKKALERQVRALSEKRIQSEGETILQKLIAKSLGCKRAKIKLMGQGKSGASVFRVSYNVGREPKEVILKLCYDPDGKNGGLRKLKQEVNGYLQARNTLNRGGYVKYLPELIEPKSANVSRNKTDMYVVHHDGWHGICYHFLGGDAFGDDGVIDLATMLMDSSEALLGKMKGLKPRPEIKEKHSDAQPQIIATRIEILTRILEKLSHYWYENKSIPKAGLTRGKIWEFDGMERDKFAPKPPYWLSQKTKEEILQFLASWEAGLGSRLFRDDWDTILRKVRGFIEEGAKQPPLDQLRPSQMTMSPVHGDLNANNILFWVEEMHPFLIDFPFFQECGHAMQDFATLECEVKFALMGRQKDAAVEDLKAYDYTHSQIEVWQDLEDYLCNRQDWKQKTGPWPSEKYPTSATMHRNAELARALVEKIRDTAREVRISHKLGSDWKGFYAEYFPALLYHTLRNISYESLSVFKRLLAVYSASKLIETMR